ncbi:MAG: CDP-diacylglycerol--glycerol-3-phosphate 3-phosphatidyltransferase [Oscillospiraceae bacterium]|nr:CDP-diacylglycerol--glycerol-3-phosphate 3-phosphatidyltransferase [Oscillospiraceae bacterium]
MNLPNKLTLMRVILVPFFILFFYLDKLPGNYLIAFIIFAAASITDALDGHIARKNNLITNFGKFLDPLADKVLVMAALACFVEKGLMSAIPLIIIIAREFMVSGLRLVTANEGIVVAAGIWGKLKTAFTMVSIVIILVFCIAGVTDKLKLISDILIWISAALTIISGVVYLKGYWKYIDTDK